jgi:alkyl sulfatase BDS1-like metallo-beta-lactamase superfamily hydrolase
MNRKWRLMMHKQFKSLLWLVLLSGPALVLAQISPPDELTGTFVKRAGILQNEFQKGLVKAADGIWVAVGYGAANTTLIEGDTGAIIIDTMYGTEAARHALAVFREVTDKPITAIIITHGHADHKGATSVFQEDGTPLILARRPAEATLARYGELASVRSERGRRQFGSGLALADKIDGIAPVHRPTGGVQAGVVKPTRYVEAEREAISIAGVNLVLLAGPGETADHLLIWLPEQRVLFGGDNFYMSFPNLYAIRGISYRDVSQWVDTLDSMISLEAEVLITGHSRPVIGAPTVRSVLTDYRNAIDHVLTATLAGANRGMTPDELAASVRLPANLAEKPYLQEYYGVIEWSVRSIYAGYLGWFNGNPTQLFPLSPLDEAERMIRLAGSAATLLEAAREALTMGEYQWACQLLDHLLVLEPDSRDLKQLKASALRFLAASQPSSNSRHYYLSSAEELESP